MANKMIDALMAAGFAALPNCEFVKNNMTAYWERTSAYTELVTVYLDSKGRELKRFANHQSLLNFLMAR